MIGTAVNVIVHGQSTERICDIEQTAESDVRTDACLLLIEVDLREENAGYIIVHAHIDRVLQSGDDKIRRIVIMSSVEGVI